MKRFPPRPVPTLAALTAALLIGGLYAWYHPMHVISSAYAASPASVQLPFTYPFSVDGRLEEVSAMDRSSSPYWWVTSGAFMDLAQGAGRTNLGDLPLGSKWQVRYAVTNPVDTDLGLHPQNTFRMLLRTKWKDIAQETSFKIKKTNLSASPARAASNGLLHMVRYADQNNLYYTGLRVDGYAVIKKKIAGRYYTMAYKRIVQGGAYNRLTNPNLLPLDTWIRLKTVVKNLDATRVSVKLYTDVGNTGTWKLATEAIDNGTSYGGGAFLQEGYFGMRTDFMDVEFDNFRLTAP